MDSYSEIWGRITELLRKGLTSTAVATWFNECRIVELSENRMVLYEESDMKRDVIITRYTGNLKEALRELFAADFDVTVIGDAGLSAFGTEPSERMQYDDEFTFERFVVGKSNDFAYAAAKAVAEGQIRNYNPLFIYGDSGLGKTHLLYAIRHEVMSRHPDYKAVFVKGETFTNELIAAIQSGKNVEFREKYRNANLFLMDDVQFIAGRESTQEEFFNTFNALYEAGRQIVFTSDRPPSEIMRLADRLRTRFESGILADIKPPDYETRMAIIKNKSQQIGMTLPEDVVNYIAENLTSNVRQLEGAVKKVHAMNELMGNEITVASVSQMLKTMFKEKTEFLPTPAIIIEETAKYFDVSEDDVKSQRKTKNIAFPRQISMYLIRKLTNLPLKDIGDIYERDHTTVLASIRKIEEIIAEDTELSNMIKDITSNINSRA